MCSHADACAQAGGCFLDRPPSREGLPYEFHITVKDADLDAFKLCCADTKVKPILLDLHLAAGGIMKDLMTSSTHFYLDLAAARQHLDFLADIFRGSGFNVVRTKIETVPWHPDAPSVSKKLDFGANQYFESHIPVRVDAFFSATLRHLAQLHGAHASRNAFKKEEDGRYILMLTLRDYDLPYELHTEKVLALEAAILEEPKFKFELPKPTRTEFAIFDSKPQHDYLWLKAA